MTEQTNSRTEARPTGWGESGLPGVCADSPQCSCWRRRCTFCPRTTDSRECWRCSSHSRGSGNTLHPSCLQTERRKVVSTNQVRTVGIAAVKPTTRNTSVDSPSTTMIFWIQCKCNRSMNIWQKWIDRTLIYLGHQDQIISVFFINMYFIVLFLCIFYLE